MIITHYSFQDLEYTLMILEILLQQINKGDQGNVPLLVKKLHSVLTIKDLYQDLRISALLGFPQSVECR